MKLPVRLGVYAAALPIVTVYLIWSEIQHSKAMLATDPSAMAVWGFLPFLIPIFILQAFIYVFPVSIVIEIGLTIWRRFK